MYLFKLERYALNCVVNALGTKFKFTSYSSAFLGVFFKVNSIEFLSQLKLDVMISMSIGFQYNIKTYGNLLLHMGRICQSMQMYVVSGSAVWKEDITPCLPFCFNCFYHEHISVQKANMSFLINCLPVWGFTINRRLFRLFTSSNDVMANK